MKSFGKFFNKIGETDERNGFIVIRKITAVEQMFQNWAKNCFIEIHTGEKKSSTLPFELLSSKAYIFTTKLLKVGIKNRIVIVFHWPGIGKSILRIVSIHLERFNRVWRRTWVDWDENGRIFKHSASSFRPYISRNYMEHRLLTAGTRRTQSRRYIHCIWKIMFVFLKKEQIIAGVRLLFFTSRIHIC